jgi:DNA mismatch repair protein MutS2
LPEVIGEARENLDVSAQEAENYLRRLQDETKQATDLRIALEEEREATALKYASLEIEASKKEKERQRQFEKELAQTIEEFDRQSRAFVDGLEDKALKTKLEKERSTRKAELNRAVMSKVTAGSKVQGPRSKASGVGIDIDKSVAVAVGSRVVTSFGNIGVVEKMDKEIAEVLVGGMRLREKIGNLQVVAEAAQGTDGKLEKLQKDSKTSNLRLDVEDMNAELNLIGQTTADAEYEIDRFLDEAYLAALPRVRIIHGFGTGALKNFVHHFLKGHPHIAKFGFAPQDQGGQGATIAELKQ